MFISYYVNVLLINKTRQSLVKRQTNLIEMDKSSNFT